MLRGTLELARRRRSDIDISMLKLNLSRFTALGSLLTACMMVAQGARASELGKDGALALSADRLMGFYWEDAGPSSRNLGVGAAPYFAPGPSTMTRFSLDYFVAPKLSIGGSFAFFLTSREGPMGRNLKFDGFLLAPRVGYAIAFSSGFGFWPRGGLTFWDVETDDEAALTLEAPFYAEVGRSWGLTFGPMLDFGFLGEDPEHKVLGLVALGLYGAL
jgi:hypothetical protein